MSDEPAITVVPAGPLSDAEFKILTEWRETKTRASLAPAIGASLFNLFIRGYTCEEIQQENRAYTLGQVLEVRVRDKWDERRDAHIDHLYGTIHGRVRQTQMESIVFTTDLLAAAHRLYGDKLRKFLQSGREEDLDTARNLIQSLDAYRKVADVLLKLTGQDKDKEKRADLSPRTIMTEKLGVGAPPTAEAGPLKALPAGTTEVMAPDMASRVLEFFADKSRDRDGSAD